MAKNDTHVSYCQTVGKDFQSRTHEFGLTVTSAGPKIDLDKVKRGQETCEAVVRNALGVKIGRRRHELDALAQEFFGATWEEVASGVTRGEEVL